MKEMVKRTGESDMARAAKRFDAMGRLLRNNLRRLKRKRTEASLLARAMKLLGLSPGRWTKRVYEAKKTLFILLDDFERWQEIEKDCNTPSKKYEYLLSLRGFHTSAPGYKTVPDGTYTREEGTKRAAETRNDWVKKLDRTKRWQDARATRARKLAECMDIGEVDLSSVTIENAHIFVAKEIAAINLELNEIGVTMLRCNAGDKCTIVSAFDTDTGKWMRRIGPPVVLSRCGGYTACNSCRRFATEADELKDALYDLTGGLLDIPRSGISRKRGRPRRKREAQ